MYCDVCNANPCECIPEPRAAQEDPSSPYPASAEGEPAAPPPPALIPLDASERTVSFTPKGYGKITFVFRRISCASWKKYFVAGTVESEHPQQALQISRFDTDTPALELVERELLRVEGYSLAGGGEFMKLANWKAKIPIGHKRFAAGLLDSARVSLAEGPVLISPELDEVFLDCFWGTPVSGFLEYRRLAHRFASPTPEHQRRYFRAASESRIEGSGRTGKTVYANRAPILMEIYDDLVREVEGYSVAGTPLVAERARIVEFMDGEHKVAAVSQLFERPVIEEAAQAVA